MPTSTQSVSSSAAWTQAWALPDFRVRFLVVSVLLVVLAVTIPYFFALIQARPGVVLPDPVLARLPAHDVSEVTFAVIYLSITAGLAHLITRPQALLRVMWAYLLLHLIRIGTLWLLPLDPPTGLVLLHDPLVDYFFYSSPAPITKDLFFSGHTATAVLLTLGVRQRSLQRWLLLATVAVGFLVLVQHVHYTYDVLAAVPFTWFSFWLAGKLTS
ncbi:phosphatase PAP2-related protein [Hymenobacter sp. BT491]|uniref:phosphatase PAP2-related protein n=1 Tax=Hymenobacter sp. BT491 TaxID=2766779 RepID=UPI0016538649|nr:phosphatase PAP2-related protein [Hymenobacter sp. BT491]MBC6991264.1 phosphatase PAP2 family protein [Hymenobacter sp. BT491]